MADILIVEDEQLTIMELEELLDQAGYNVAGTTASGEEAVRKAEELDPDLILMDIRLKGEIDGIEAVQTIRGKKEVPVIYLTAHSDEDTLRDAQQTRPEGYLVKPFTDDELDETIEMAVAE